MWDSGVSDNKRDGRTPEAEQQLHSPGGKGRFSIGAKGGQQRGYVLLARWYAGNNNWGDALNPILIEKISGIKPINLQHQRIGYWKLRQIAAINPKPEYLVIGSTLGWGFRRGDVNVFWGPGFMYEDQLVRATPRHVYAVRGPLSRTKLLAQGVPCPDVYGDPALLMPRFYSPPRTCRYELGVVPHHADRNTPWINKLRNETDIRIIDICSGIYRVIDEILKCERIVSSSLHGLIASDAYGIPSLWVQFSDNVSGRGFKFRDYYASVGRVGAEPLRVTLDVSLSTISKAVGKYDISLPDLDRLLDACPFRK